MCFSLIKLFSKLLKLIFDVRCVRFLLSNVLVIYNVIFGLFGLAIVIVGIAVLLQFESVIAVFDKRDIIVIPIFYIIFGNFIFILSIIGFCGLIKSSNCLKILYKILMINMILVAIIVGIAMLFLVDWVRDAATTYIKHMWIEPKNSNFWNATQTAFKCCGYNDSRDWLIDKLPNSCCKLSPCTTENSFKIGCKDAIDNFLIANNAKLGGIILCFAAVAIIGTVIACSIPSITKY